MDKKYWDKVAVDYDSEIFSCLANDQRDIITTMISKLASKKAVACDFGCGVGKFLPLLSKHFDHVYAVDISSKLISQARQNCSGMSNITYARKDLSKAAGKCKKVDFTLCINAAIMPSAEVRLGIFKTIHRHLRKGGFLVLVVPSLESALYADFRLLQWNLKAGLKGPDAVEELDNGDTLSLRQGLVEIDDVATKHYLKEELITTFKDLGFKIELIGKVKYHWDTEFDKPPKWTSGPYPWDWLAVLKKK